VDSLTHVVVGAALGDRLLNKKVGRWGALIGAFLNTFPDFDLLYTGLNDPRAYILYHRAHTHSIFYQLLYCTLLAALFWWIVQTVRKRSNAKWEERNKLQLLQRDLEPNSFLGMDMKGPKELVSFPYWLMVVLVCVLSHSLMDIFTDYGTRWFLPFSEKLVALNSIAILDLCLTLPIFLLVLIGIFFKNKSRDRRWWMDTALLYTVIYFGFTLINKASVDKVFKQSLVEQNIPHNSYMSDPTILNNFLWFAIAQNEDSMYTTEYSTLWKTKDLKWTAYPRNKDLFDQWTDTVDKDMMGWFSQGFFVTQQKADSLYFFPTKFGRNDFRLQTPVDTAFVMKYWFHKDSVKNKWVMNYTDPGEANDMDFKAAFLGLMRTIRKPAWEGEEF